MNSFDFLLNNKKENGNVRLVFSDMKLNEIEDKYTLEEDQFLIRTADDLKLLIENTNGYILARYLQNNDEYDIWKDFHYRIPYYIQEYHKPISRDAIVYYNNIENYWVVRIIKDLED